MHRFYECIRLKRREERKKIIALNRKFIIIESYHMFIVFLIWITLILKLNNLFIFFYILLILILTIVDSMAERRIKERREKKEINWIVQNYCNWNIIFFCAHTWDLRNGEKEKIKINFQVSFCSAVGVGGKVY